MSLRVGKRATKKVYPDNYPFKYRQQYSEAYKQRLADQQLETEAINQQQLHFKDALDKSYHYVYQPAGADAPVYKANLVCYKCQAPGCKNMVCLGLPLCSEHWAEIGIVRKEAFNKRGPGKKSIGYGVFVAPGKCFPPRYKIMQYVGELLPHDVLDSAFPGETLAPYTYGVRKQNMNISSERVRGMASYINHSKNPNVKITTIKQNHTYLLYVVSLRFICAGEELLLDYGDDYLKQKMPSNKESYTVEGSTVNEILGDIPQRPVLNSIHGTEYPISHSNSNRFRFANCPQSKRSCKRAKERHMPLNMEQDRRRA
jgi:hypothetical protein